MLGALIDLLVASITMICPRSVLLVLLLLSDEEVFAGLLALCEGVTTALVSHNLCYKSKG